MRFANTAAVLCGALAVLLGGCAEGSRRTRAPVATPAPTVTPSAPAATPSASPSPSPSPSTSPPAPTPAPASIERVSVAGDGTPTAMAPEFSVAISGDGGRIAFSCRDSRLAPGAISGTIELFVRDAPAARTSLISGGP